MSLIGNSLEYLDSTLSCSNMAVSINTIVKHRLENEEEETLVFAHKSELKFCPVNVKIKTQQNYTIFFIKG